MQENKAPMYENSPPHSRDLSDLPHTNCWDIKTAQSPAESANQYKAAASQPCEIQIFTQRERKLIESCPSSGDGVHDWSFKVLRILSRSYSNDTSLIDASHAIFDKFATRQIDNGEILRQIGNARRCSGGGGFGNRSNSGRGSSSSWPLPDLGAIESIVRSGPCLAQLQSALLRCSDHRLERSSDILQRLFPGDPLLCCGKHLWSAHTLPISNWEHLGECQFIVPSPMTNKHGLTCAGKDSMRCLDNTGPRHFLVIEFDFKADDGSGSGGSVTPDHPLANPSVVLKSRMVSRLLRDGFTVHDMCAALIHHLASYVSPVLVVYSGGKSLHTWFPCKGVEDDTLRPFMRYAVQIGADRATWSRCQFVRMPGGLRDNGNRQTVHYFNPEGLP